MCDWRATATCSINWSLPALCRPAIPFAFAANGWVIYRTLGQDVECGTLRQRRKDLPTTTSSPPPRLNRRSPVGRYSTIAIDTWFCCVGGPEPIAATIRPLHRIDLNASTGSCVGTRDVALFFDVSGG